ncbi:MAG TPA: EAL domain-containing protein [Lysobacter sp.]|nr:EAL domain-containing protein [Lysobacter sp.]
MAWCEVRLSPSGEPRRKAWLWPTLMGLALASGIIVSDRIRVALAPFGNGHTAVLMDYRFALFALLGWCALRLRLRVSMLLLALAMFALVQLLAGTAERNGTALGFLNLTHLAFELAVLLMAMLYFVIFDRDAREFAAQLVEETRRDTATGLPNLAALRHQIQRAGALPPQGEVGFLLLDHADHLVTGFGLDIQAQVMTTVAAELAGTAQSFVLGMGQFALLPADGTASEDDWERVIDAVDAIEFDSGGYRFGLSPYLGVARRTDAAPESVEAALLLASQQAFEARRRNELRPLYDADSPASPSGMRHQLHAATGALADLRSGRMELYFQPIRPLDPAHPDSQAPDHAIGEVLCRLRDAQGRLQEPGAFLGPIDSVGRSVELDLAVVRTLFELLRQHPQALPSIKRMAVNLTGHSLASTSFKRQFDILLADSPLPLSALCFEITENAVLSSTAHTQDFLDDLRQRGCSIAIDDFGTGMQSFARLKELPVDILKIDGSFVRHVTQHGRDYALVEASVSIARAFDFTTVAEFVETQAIADCLRELGVQWMQGYLYAKPQPLVDVLAAAGRGKSDLLPDTPPPTYLASDIRTP